MTETGCKSGARSLVPHELDPGVYIRKILRMVHKIRTTIVTHTENFILCALVDCNSRTLKVRPKCCDLGEPRVWGRAYLRNKRVPLSVTKRDVVATLR